MNLAMAVYIEGSCTCNDNEPRDDVGEDGANEYIESRSGIIFCGDSLLYHRRLQIKLHPWSDGGADHSDDHVQVGLILEFARMRRRDGADCRLSQVRSRQEASYDVRQIKERSGQEYLLHHFVVPFHDQEPHECRGNRNGDVL